MASLATPEDLAEFLDTDLADLPPNAQGLLDRAADLITHLTMTARYETGEDGKPVPGVTRDALVRATCAQAAWFDETGDTSGAGARYNSLSLASFSASGGGTGSGTNVTVAASRISSEAITILSAHGLITTPPVGS